MIELLGPYRIERLLGRGGMGTVYAGVHTETGQRAAIKSLAVNLTHDSNLRDRFLAEIETLKRLKHPNIVELYGDGEQDGQLFYAMELVDGPTLQEELHNGRRFEPMEVIQVAIEVCQALKHAHDRGIIHRDLKPANLLRAPDGSIKLSDFGIAKLFGMSQLTAHGSVVGTADFMAPEQAEGNTITNRTDLYSLGAVLFALLARRPPFVGPNLPNIFHKLRNEEAPPVRRFAPQTPLELDLLIQQLLKKDPAERTPTALALSNRLKAMQHALSRPDLNQSAGAEDTDFSVSESANPGGETAESPTRFVTGEGPSTELAPTAIVPSASNSFPSDSPTGNEVTSPSLRVPSSAESPPASRPTVADAPDTRGNRFTWRHESLDRAESEIESDAQGNRTSLIQAIGLAAALIAIIAAVTWAAWPTSANRLYQRIHAISATQSPEDAVNQIDEFLRRFPDDPRAKEVADLRLDVECSWLQSRMALKELKSGGSRLEPFERELLGAMRQRTKDAAAAQDLLKKYVDKYGQEESSSPTLQRCLKSAKHLLKRLQESAANPQPQQPKQS